MFEARSMRYLLPLLIAACSYEMPAAPVLGYEFDDTACSDGVDNDQDQLTDCEDPDCLVVSTHCGQQIPYFPTDAPNKVCCVVTRSITMTTDNLIAVTRHSASNGKLLYFRIL